MTTATASQYSQNVSPIAVPTLLSLVTALFGLNLRETINAASAADQGEAAYFYGM